MRWTRGSRSRASGGQAVLDGGGGRVSIKGEGRWHGKDRAGPGPGERGRGESSVRPGPEDGGDGVEMFRKQLDEGQAGTRGVSATGSGEGRSGAMGRCWPKPGASSRTASSREVYVLKKEEGGRHHAVFTNYRPQFYIRTTDVTGRCSCPRDVKMVMPGDNITMEIELLTHVALEIRCVFRIAEGGTTVGAASLRRSSSEGGRAAAAPDGHAGGLRRKATRNG